MSLRYLVGTGARNWNSTAIWSDTSGGTGGFSVPTSADAVIFDANSGTGNLTLDVAASVGSLDSSALTAIVTLVSSVYVFNNYGSLTLNGTYSKFSFTGTAYYYQKGTGTITTNGNLFLALNRLYIDGVGITVTNGDDCNVGVTQINIVNGTYNSNSKTINSTGDLNIQTGTKSIIFDNSIINVSRFNPGGVAINSVTCGQSTLNITGNAFCGDGKTYYNVNLNWVGTTTILGSNTYNNLTYNGGANINSSISIGANQIISNILNIIGYNNTNYRALLASNTIGTPRTITCNGTIVASNVDFRDITLAGSANRDLSAITGGSGDCGGNSGITFTPAQKQYFKHTSGAVNFGDATKWFTDFSPRTTAGRVPLPQDDWDFDASSFTGTSTVTVNCPRIGRSCDMSGVNQAVTWSLANAIECYGSYVLGGNITPSGNLYVYLFGRGNFNLNCSKISYGFRINSYGGIYMQLSDLIISALLEINIGTYDLNYFNIFFSNSQMSFNNSGICYLRSGVLSSTVLAGVAINVQPVTTIYPGTSTIVFTPASGGFDITLALSNKTFNKIQLSGSHTGNFNILGSNTIAELIIDAGRKVRFTAGTTQQIGKATIGAGASIDSITAATHTLNFTGTDVVETDGVSVKNSIAIPANKWFAGASSTNLGGNTGWLFVAFGYKLMKGLLRVKRIFKGSTEITNAYRGSTSIRNY